MPPQLLDPRAVERLRSLPLSYTGEPLREPAEDDGLWRLTTSRVLGRGEGTLDRATAALLSWRMHEGAGFDVHVSSHTLEVGTIVLQQTRLGPWRVTAPCRVVRVERLGDVRGFAYGTLPGHPVRGEEAFTMRRSADGEVIAEIRAASRPAWSLARLGTPITRNQQRAIAERYLDALVALAH
ncbi:MAG TPA: DUF1990 domain-containing protein [Candidatus Nanopelagicales bacterium]|nr:DUF1990 domain-containing protein [Candidatus Nanopelagicales bacterium]